MSARLPRIAFDNSYARDLPGFYAPCSPVRVARPALLYFHSELANELGLDLQEQDEELAQLFCGNVLPDGAVPIAQAYAGHQFGRFSPRLGDGRALLIGEVLDRDGRRRDIAFKGSGRTPFSRSGDGKAAIGPMLREVIVGEAMHALGIPTTRALAVVATGEAVYRERTLPGAVLTRIAGSHLRVGTFEFFAAHADVEQVRQLADYAIARHYPELTDADDRYAGFLQAVIEQQAALIARWMHAGFIHGVMNTDNMSIGGETIDFGPCAFLEAYDPQAVFSSIDEHGRYAYGEQPRIATWNLARLAEALLPLIADNEDIAVRKATDIVKTFPDRYRQFWRAGLCDKLGLQPDTDDAENVEALGEAWLEMLHASRADYTLAWRHLADAAEGNESMLRSQFAEQAPLDAWLARWRERCIAEDGFSDPPATQVAARAARIRRANPWVIPRNHRVEEALSAAQEAGDLEPFRRLLAAVRQPFDTSSSQALYAEPAPAEFMAGFRTFCGT